jgi:hypothetical protein
MVITRLSANDWISSHVLADANGSTQFPSIGGGVKSLSAELDRLRLLPSGVNTFDNGNVTITYE